MLTINGLRKSYGKTAKVLNDVSFHMESSEIIGLIGASGAGKSTVGRILANLERADHGEILFEGQDLTKLPTKERRKLSRAIQMIFQDPYATLSPHMKVKELIEEALIILKMEPDASKRTVLIRKALEDVSLNPDRYLERFPHELSGGERQRVGIARAIVCNPKLIIADEPTSMLDTSLRLELIELLKKLNVQRGTAFLFITHDIALTQHFCNRLIVLNNGEIVDEGLTHDVINYPTHTFTKKLIHALQLLEGGEGVYL